VHYPRHRIEIPFEILSKFFRKRSVFDQNQQTLNNVEPVERLVSTIICKQSEPARTMSKIEKRREFVEALCIEQFLHYALHNASTNSLLFSILEMVLAGSDCLHMISGGFDSFIRDLHAFRKRPPPEICQVE